MSTRMQKKLNNPSSNPTRMPQPRAIPIQYREILKQFEEKQALIRFRHDALLRQRNSNYRGEHDRIRGHLHSINQGLGNVSDIARLRNRQGHLEQMFQHALA